MVRMFNPPNLGAAYGLAKIQEENILSSKRGFREVQQGGSSNSTHHPNANLVTKATMPVQRLTPAPMQERRDKELCYYCDSKWVLGHNCRKPKLFLLERCEVKTEIEVGEDLEVDAEFVELGNDKGESEVEPEISLHAQAGSLNPKTKRVKGNVGGQSVVILIDSGSTHNFVDPMVARKDRMRVTRVDKVQVKVANEEVLASEGSCDKVKVSIQGRNFITDIYVLPLAGCDMVLGVYWLRILKTYFVEFC